jgi:signal recognition particle subunit SRP54
MGEVRNMGGLAKIIDMLPGVNKKDVTDDAIDSGEKEFAQMEAIIRSMTLEERRKPEILNASRRKRIAAGSGQSVTKVNQMIKKYEDAKKLMKQMNNPNFMKKGRFRGLFG